ncbi:hypothetical protein [Streptomyces sp. NPDC058548]|uniref:hypothetical protein n=1 Tax=Streptomyces sp. NPDC058548 TaxID=3346545 RepID=UPI003652A445
MDTRRTPHHRHIPCNRPGAMPLQVRPVHRDAPGGEAPGTGSGVEAALSSCATLTGPARQMCYAGGGVYV